MENEISKDVLNRTTRQAEKYFQIPSPQIQSYEQLQNTTEGDSLDGSAHYTP